MKWKIDEDFTIATDHYAFALKKAKKGEINPETGKSTISSGEWWFPTLNMCLKKYIQECMKECNDALTILNRLEELNDKIETLELPTFRIIKSETLLAKSNTEASPVD